MSEVKANRVAGYDDLHNAGDFFWIESTVGEVTALAYVCPCGNCGPEYRSAIPVNEGPHEGRPRWKWNGNKDSPTLTPSIQRRLHIHAHGEHPEYRCDWHGYLTDGVFRSC